MKKNLKKFLPAALVLLLTGCGIWTDFTTYFNLYFNTTKLYEEVQLDIENLEKEPFQLKEPVISNAIKTKLNSLQEKASKILQHNAESSYFDDAVFMSGYAFYYNGDYVKAKRKFTELASLNDEDYELKSKMWIGKCDLQLRNFDAGMGLLKEVKDSAIVREDDDVLKDVYKIIIGYHIDRGEYTTAITEAENLIKISGDDELNALAAYQIGLLYLEDQNEKAAVEAFESVLDYSPDFETEFNSKFQLAILNKELGNIEESREMLNELYNEGKYSPFWGDVYFQLGLIEYEAENYDAAFKIFTDVNELYSKSKGALESQLMLGEIMRTVYADYDSAKVYYDKVKGDNSDPELKEKAFLYSQSITNYLNLKDDIDKSERQIVYLQEPQEFLRDSLAYERYLATKTNRDDKNKQKESQKAPENEEENQDVTPSDSSNVTDSTKTQSAQDSLFAQTTTDLSFDDEYLLEVKPVYPTVGVDSLESNIAKDYFALGNLFFTDLIRPDSAYYYYNQLLTEFPNTKYKPRVLFALGTYYETRENKAKQDSLYQLVYDDYKTHPIANEAAKKLGKPPLIRKSDPAQLQYLDAENLMDQEYYDSTFVVLKKIVKDYPESIYRPKSIYTIGWLYENEVDQPDSAYKYYSILMDEYKNSEYTMDIRRKVGIYKTELERIEKEKQEAAEKQQEASSETPAEENAEGTENNSAQADSTVQVDSTMQTDSTQTIPEVPDTTKTNDN